MSEHEFDQFLAVFRGLLRLNPARRDEIAAELLDHFEERLADLTRNGMSHDKAVHVAVEEFGDAAGLAAQFLLVLSQQRRRKIMKWTVPGIVAAFVMLMAAYASWPVAPVRGPAPAQLVAQQRTVPPPGPLAAQDQDTPEAVQATAPAKVDAATQMEVQLGAPIAAAFDNVPLSDFLDFIEEGSNIEFYIDKSALEDSGIGMDIPITINLKRIRIDRLLDLVLGEHELMWVPRDGYVYITTFEKLQGTLETRVYNCRDLVELTPGGQLFSATNSEGLMGAEGGAMTSGMAMGMPGMGSAPGMSSGGMGMSSMGGMGGTEMGMGGMGMGGVSASGSMPLMERLINVITTTVVPDSWTDMGGPGSIAAYHGGLLVVNHHAQAHQKIEQLLRMLRDASKDKPGAIVRQR